MVGLQTNFELNVVVNKTPKFIPVGICIVNGHVGFFYFMFGIYC